MSYEAHRAWSDRHLEQARDILRNNACNFLIFPTADEEKDTKQATDMIIEVKGGDVALRARKHTNFRDMTIRTRSKWGHETEIDKIRKGFAKWYLYMWFPCDEACTGVDCKVDDYLLVDMDKMRESNLLDASYIEPRTKVNTDGLTAFAVIDIKDMAISDCIVNTTLFLC